MNQNPIDDSVAADIHDRLGRELLARLTRGQCKECGCGPATVQELEAARKFIADNGVTAVSRPGTPLHSIVDHMPHAVPDDPDEVVQRPQDKKLA